MGTIIILLIVIGLPLLFVLILIRMLKGPSGKSDNTMNAKETRMIQEMHHGFSKMEDRIEALETILMERERSGKHSTESTTHHEGF